MKKSLIRVLSVVLAVTILSACLGISAGAELKLNAGDITVNTGIKISVDGKEFVPVDSEGVPVEVFLYEGTTYLPVRGISNLFGLGIEWDDETKSVYLGTREGADLPVLGTAADAATSPFAFESKTITVHTGVSIYFNDEYFQPTDSEGFAVEVFLYNGTTYLPVRAISKLMNAEIDWDQANKTVLLSVAAEEETPAAVEAAMAVAEEYAEKADVIKSYFDCYEKICAVLDIGLEELKLLYLSAPDNIELEYMLNSYMMGYDAFEREFGEAVDQSMTLCEFAKTLEERIAAYAADGYSAEELEKLEANTSYLKENKKTLNKCVIFCEPDYMRDFIATNAGYFGDAVVARVGEI